MFEAHRDLQFQTPIIEMKSITETWSMDAEGKAREKLSGVSVGEVVDQANGSHRKIDLFTRFQLAEAVRSV